MDVATKVAEAIVRNEAGRRRKPEDEDFTKLEFR